MTSLECYLVPVLRDLVFEFLLPRSQWLNITVLLKTQEPILLDRLSEQMIENKNCCNTNTNTNTNYKYKFKSTPEAWKLAAAFGDLVILKWLELNQHKGPNKSTTHAALSAGRLDVIQWLYQTKKFHIDDCMDVAAEHGHWHVLEWLYEHVRPPKKRIYSEKAMDSAAQNGHFDVLKWLDPRTNLCTYFAMDRAAENGHLSILKWLHANRLEGCSKYAMDCAAKENHVHVLEWLQSNRTEGCSDLAMYYAARFGRLESMQWLCAHRKEGPYYNAAEVCAMHGHLQVLQFLYNTRRCPLEKPRQLAVRDGQAHIVKWIDDVKKL